MPNTKMESCIDDLVNELGDMLSRLQSLYDFQHIADITIDTNITELLKDYQSSLQSICTSLIYDINALQSMLNKVQSLSQEASFFIPEYLNHLTTALRVHDNFKKYVDELHPGIFEGRK